MEFKLLGCIGEAKENKTQQIRNSSAAEEEQEQEHSDGQDGRVIWRAAEFGAPRCDGAMVDQRKPRHKNSFGNVHTTSTIHALGTTCPTAHAPTQAKNTTHQKLGE